LAGGEAPSLLRYFYNQTLENSSFQHPEQLDDKGQITNKFWANAKMVIDYVQFSDVVIFDTTYRTNKEYRSLGYLLNLIILERS
jgi:zinc finger SWIM domain-containing protein 3